MSPRVDDAAVAAIATDPASGGSALAVPVLALPFDADADLGSGLPPDHPAWSRDTVSISQRARQIVAALQPVVVRVMTFWDHAVRSISLGGARRLEVDPSGCYRMP